MNPFLESAPALLVLWSAVTVGLYLAGKNLHRRIPRWWPTPLIATPLALGLILIAFHVAYADYYRNAGWLVSALGPATVAFAVPIHEHRALIRRRWPALMIGMIVGSTASVVACWLTASALGVDGTLRLSLLPRSISTPFAMAMSRDIGGTPGLTAVFVVITGLFGAAIGELSPGSFPIRSALARGAAFGMGAHAVGTARAHRVSAEIGSISGLVMVLAGLMNVAVGSVLVAAGG